MKPYLECSFHIDFEICITNEYSCRNNGDGVEVSVKIWYIDEKIIFKLYFYTLSKTQKSLKPNLESSLHIYLKNDIKIEFSCRTDGENR